MALTDGLVAYFSMESNANDATGVNNGTASNVSWTTGKISNCGSFNGSTSRIQCPDSTSLSITGNYTFSMWLKITSLPTSGGLVSILNKYDQGANSGGYDFGLYNNAGTQQVGMTNGSGGSSGGGYINYTFSTGTFVHAIVEYNGTTSVLYVNNTSVGSIANTLNPANNTKLLNIGNFGYYTPTSGELGRYYNGLIDELGMWNRVLTSTERSQLYNGGNGLSYPLTVNNSGFFMFF